MTAAALDHDLVDCAAGLAVLIGERDLELVEPQANAQGLAWLKACAVAELLKAPVAVVASLTDQEAVQAAIALLTCLHLPEPLKRALATIDPPMRAQFGRLEHRAVHARQILTLIAADPMVRTCNHAPGGAQ